MKKCNIKPHGKYRNGKQKYWCSIHRAFAFADNKGNVDQCDNYDVEEIKDSEKLYIDPKDWDGGIGLWGSLMPVYSTTDEHFSETGIHVHARSSDLKEKHIDGTFKEVHVKSDSTELFTDNMHIKLNSEIARAYTCSMVIGKQMKYLTCKHCGTPHIDSDYFAVTYHRKHLCTHCGREFLDSIDGISNPIIGIKEIFKEQFNEQSILLVDKTLNINQSDYHGGIEIWGSNPAILWTAKRHEEAGIHIHVYDEKQERVIDDTFGEVVIDGVTLHESQIRYLMVQNSLEHLNKKVKSLDCPQCHKPHFDRGDLAIRLHKHHLCEYCGEEFVSKIKCVSNPTRKILKQLKSNHEALQKK